MNEKCSAVKVGSLCLIVFFSLPENPFQKQTKLAKTTNIAFSGETFENQKNFHQVSL
jgi:hypothetical protein